MHTRPVLRAIHRWRFKALVTTGAATANSDTTSEPASSRLANGHIS